MTTTDLAPLIGSELLMWATTGDRRGATGLLSVRVKVLDARENFGRVDLLVTPVAGEGQAWVSKERCREVGK